MVDTMPTFGIRTVSKFDLEYVDAVNVLRSGAGYGIELGKPYWDISMATAEYVISNPIYNDWRTFLDSLRGQKRAGFFFDAKRPFPITYPNGFGGLTVAITGTPFTGLAAADVFASRREIDISGLPVGLVLKKSDYVSFKSGDNQSLHRLSTNVVSSGTGTATIFVEPAVPLIYTSAAEVHFDRPACKAILQGSISDSHDIESGSISFQARSVAEWGGGV